MLDIFKRLARVFKRRRVQTDSLVFRLHYSVTVAFLLLFCVIVTFNQYFRKPLTCSEVGSKDSNMVDEFCLTRSKYVSPELPNLREIVHPGITFNDRDRKMISLKYYQWIFIYLFFQAILFYVPRLLWKNWEGGKLRALRNYLNVGLMPEDEREDKKRLLVKYLHDYRNCNTLWTCQYLVCEILALINVFGQMSFMNTLFDGKFWSLGKNSLNHTESNGEDAITQLFPIVRRCSYHKFGVSGVVELHNAVCILSLNVLYAKIFVFLWFWFVMLLIVTSAWIIFRFVTIIPFIRKLVLCCRCRCHVQYNIINKIVVHSNVGDWFFLNMVGQNVDTLLFSDVLKDLAEQQEGPKGRDLNLSRIYP
ncbi:innexin shaking-B-like [Periplaneta americana]|uniref:innexin shaking-B-like n=1 Tax=Periplaneta americana TaxID=6978 RepID=UPI0037E94BBB